MDNKEMVKSVDLLINELEERIVKQVTRDKCIMSLSENTQNRLDHLEDLKDDLKKNEI